MVNCFRNAAMLLTFTAIAGSNLVWDFMDSYLASGLALSASFLAALCVERIFIDRA